VRRSWTVTSEASGQHHYDAAHGLSREPSKVFILALRDNHERVVVNDLAASFAPAPAIAG